MRFGCTLRNYWAFCVSKWGKEMSKIRRFFSIKHVNVGFITKYKIVCFVDRASMYTLVNKANLMYNLFLVYLSISTCFGRLCAHHLCLCDAWYLLFCVDDCLICRSICSCIPSTKCRINTVVSLDDGHIVATLPTCYSV